MQITFEQVKTELSIAKSIYDISQNIKLYNENCAALNSMDIIQIRTQLQKSIDKHGGTIKKLSLFTGMTLVHYQELPFYIAYSSLSYITQNIPLYVAVEQLTEKALEAFFRKLTTQCCQKESP